jgi:hypothetical protein
MSSYAATIECYGRRRRKEIEPLTLIDGRKHTISDKFRITVYNPMPVPQSTYLEMERAEILEDIANGEDLIAVETPLNRQKNGKDLLDW